MNTFSTILSVLCRCCSFFVLHSHQGYLKGLQPKSMINEKISTVLVGGSGIAVSTLAENAAFLNPVAITEAGSLLVQILIGVVTLFRLFKKKKV